MPVLGMARRDFEPRAEAVRAARHFALTEANGWGIDPGDLEIVVGELAANAFRHAGTPFTVALSYIDQSLTVEVADGSRALPIPVPTVSADMGAAAQASGRGLLMVDTLVLAWGARSAPQGKIVWAELATVELESANPFAG
jgi:anti-sigma regulatory factor (Ser/Thr protein kinase)